MYGLDSYRSGMLCLWDFCSVLASFGILSLLMARTFIDPGPHFEGVSIGLPHNYYEDDKADQLKDFPLDFSLSNLHSEDLPLSGYGLVLYICFFGSFVFSVLLCYGIHKRDPNHLRMYLVFGFVLTALMLMCFFYLFVWFTDITFFTFIPMYMTLSMHLAVRCVIRRTQQLFYAEQYSGIAQLNGFYIKHS